ncbi:hypothetical protein BKA62DRAFT_707314 [Auriculariales sp. MPI-PUGE-AT-0066]|nr:hypothetical protein BKA62DRAFT_707314 [Auriculariales sp. MPI-PUGE-AT-0066]
MSTLLQPLLPSHSLNDSQQAGHPLPPDVLREVFEWAVRMNIERRRRWASSLMLVSQVVRIWLMPHVYAVVVLRCSSLSPMCPAWSFLAGLALDPASPVRNHVKHVVILPIDKQLAGPQHTHTDTLPETYSPSAGGAAAAPTPWDIDTLVGDTSTIRLFARNSIIRPRRVFCLSVFPHLWPEDCLAFSAVTQVRFTESYLGAPTSGWDMKASTWAWTMACLPMLQDALLEVNFGNNCTQEQFVDLVAHIFGYFPVARIALSHGSTFSFKEACPQDAVEGATDLMRNGMEGVVVEQTVGEEDAALQFARQVWDQLDPWNPTIGNFQS